MMIGSLAAIAYRSIMVWAFVVVWFSVRVMHRDRPAPYARGGLTPGEWLAAAPPVRERPDFVMDEGEATGEWYVPLSGPEARRRARRSAAILAEVKRRADNDPRYFNGGV